MQSKSFHQSTFTILICLEQLDDRQH